MKSGWAVFANICWGSGTWDWDVAAHIKEHHIHTHPVSPRRRRPRPGQSASWRDPNEPNWRRRWTVFLCPFESWPPLFLLLLFSSPLRLNCMAWPKPIKIALLERVESERGVRETTTNIDFLVLLCFFTQQLRSFKLPPPFIPLGVLFIPVTSFFKRLSSGSGRTSQNTNQKLRSKQIRTAFASMTILHGVCEPLWPALRTTGLQVPTETKTSGSTRDSTGFALLLQDGGPAAATTALAPWRPASLLLPLCLCSLTLLPLVDPVCVCDSIDGSCVC